MNSLAMQAKSSSPWSGLARPRMRWLVSSFTVFFILLAVQGTFAQSSNDFPDLKQHINAQVTVETADGQITGKLLRVDEGRIVVYEAATPKPIARESIRRVTKHKSRHTVAWVAGMSAAGLGAGFLLSLRSFDDATNSNGKVGATAAAGAGGGAVAGYALSRIGKQDQVVYQAE
jgi:hypothetical protein